jgi:hypothetical protein
MNSAVLSLGMSTLSTTHSFFKEWVFRFILKIKREPSMIAKADGMDWFQ